MANRELLNYEVVTSASKALNSDWIVMIHGAGGSVRTWKYQVEDLREDFNLLMIDLRDHGLSKFDPEYAPSKYSFDLISTDIKSVIDHLDIEYAHFVSLSLGSAMIQHFMMMHPESVNKVVFIGGVFRANLNLRIAAYIAKAMNYILPYRWMYRLFSYIVMPKAKNKKARKIFINQAKKLTPKEYSKWIGLEYSFFKILKHSFHYPFHHESLIIMGGDYTTVEFLTQRDLYRKKYWPK